MFAKQIQLVKGIADFSANAGVEFLKKGIKSTQTPLIFLLGEHKQIPHPPPYSSPLFDLAYNFIWHVRSRINNERKFHSLEKKMNEKLLAESKAFGPGPRLSVPRITISDLDRKNWRAIYQGFPVVIEGFLSDSKAVRTWTLSYFKKKFPKTVVRAIKLGTSSAKTNYGEGYEPISVADLIDNIRNGGTRYCAGSGLFNSNKELLKDLRLDKLEDFFGQKLLRIEIFIGGKKVFSPFHCAPGGNFFCQIHGKKKWTLVSPKHTKWMYPLSSMGDITGISPIRTKRKAEIEKKYPLFKYVPKYEAILNPGDVLCVPPWWWHEVYNLGETIGTPLRFLSHDDVNYVSNFILASSLPALKYTFGPIFRKIFERKGRKDLFMEDNIYDNVLNLKK